jgi:hypothetical protein
MRRSSNYSNSSNNSKKDSSKLSSKMESPKLQTRTTTSTFPPPHKTQLPMRYQTQLYQNPNSAKSSAAASSLFCRKNVLIIIFILLSFLFVSIYLISLARRLQSSYAVQLLSEKGYGIVIDAASSGSRIHVFEYTQGHISAAVDLVGLESSTLRKKPGLSSFANNPPLAGDSLKELLEFATQKVPKKEQSKTRVYLMATSGLRRLDENVREALLDSCKDVLRASKFLFHDKWVSVISGREKGIYAWVSANYALGTLHSDPLQTTGIIELGQASTQVTFVPEVPPPPSFKHTLELGGKTFVLYSYSFLNYGQVCLSFSRQMLISFVLLFSVLLRPHGQLHLAPCTSVKGGILGNSLRTPLFDLFLLQNLCTSSGKDPQVASLFLRIMFLMSPEVSQQM